MDAGNAARESDFFPGYLLMTTTTIERKAMANHATIISEPLFRSAHAALVFAFNFTMQQYDRPLMNKVASKDSEQGEGKGLSGQDGAAQAGMIRRRLSTLPPLQQAIMVARTAPATLVCSCGAPCCQGRQANLEWTAAIRLVADSAEKEALASCTINRGLTLGLLTRLFGQGKGQQMSDIAEQAGVSSNTATNHLSRLKLWLHGSKTRGVVVGVGQEALAIFAAEQALTDAGIVGALGDIA